MSDDGQGSATSTNADVMGEVLQGTGDIELTEPKCTPFNASKLNLLQAPCTANGTDAALVSLGKGLASLSVRPVACHGHGPVILRYCAGSDVASTEAAARQYSLGDASMIAQAGDTAQLTGKGGALVSGSPNTSVSNQGDAETPNMQPEHLDSSQSPQKTPPGMQALQGRDAALTSSHHNSSHFALVQTR